MDWLKDRVRFHLDPSHSQGKVFVAMEGGQTIGHIIVRAEREGEERLGYLSTIYVQPEYRRRRVAATLLDAGERWLRSLGLQHFVYYTAVTNAPIISLFSQVGYEVVDARHGPTW